MDLNEVEEGKYYKLTYPNKEKIVKLIYKFWDGDCEIAFKNGKKDRYHVHWLEPIETNLGR